MNTEDIKKNILLVEDSRFTSKLITDFLNENGYKVYVIDNGEEAIKRIKDGLQTDLILMDIILKGETDGIEAARNILEFKDIPIVFMTGNTSRSIIDKIKEVRAYGFVSKSTDITVLLSVVEMALKLYEANAQIKIKETTLSAIMDATQDSIIMFDEQWNVTFCNLAAERLLGYSKEEILNGGLKRLLVSYKQVYDLHKTDYNYLKQSGKNNINGKTIELKARSKDGRNIDVEISLSVLKLKGVWHAVGVIRDISNRKLEQEKLEKSRREYLELAENSPVGVLKCDLQGNITYVNQKSLEILGSPGIVETKKINLLSFSLLVEHGVSKIIKQCIENKKSCTEELNYTTKWGKEVWLRVHIKLLGGSDKAREVQIIIDEITEKKQLEEKLRLLSITDELTGIYNRRYMKEKIEEEIKKAEQLHSTFSIIMLDIDHFKRINDCYGHDVGDYVLKTISKEITNNIRNLDILSRWGGEEFMILLPDTEVKSAAYLAEELRICLSHIDTSISENITASFGVSGYFPKDSADTLVKKADNMMYKAKNSGRNCVKYYDEQNL